MPQPTIPYTLDLGEPTIPQTFDLGEPTIPYTLDLGETSIPYTLNLGKPQFPEAAKGFASPGVSSTMSRIFNYIDRPLGLVMETAHQLQQGADPTTALKAGGHEFLTGEKGTHFEDILETAGMEPGWGRTAAGILGDVVGDPINLLPIFGVGKKVVSGLQAGGRSLVRRSPIIRDLARKFIPYSGVSDDVANHLRFARSRSMAQKQIQLDDVERRFRGMNPEDLRRRGAFHIDEPGRIPLADDASRVPLAEQAQKFQDDFVEEMRYGVIDPKREITDQGYVPYFMSDPHVKPLIRGRDVTFDMPSAHKRNLKSLAQMEHYAKEVGAEPELNIGRIASIRQYHSQRSRGNAAMLLHMVGGSVDDAVTPAQLREGVSALRHGNIPDNFKGVVVRATEKDAPAGWQKIAIGEHQPGLRRFFQGDKKDPAAYWFAPDEAAAINRIFTFDPSPGELGRIVDRITSAWKTSTTVIRPSFHTRNAVSNLWAMHLAGMNPGEVSTYMVRSTTWGLRKPTSQVFHLGKEQAESFSKILGRAVDGPISKADLDEAMHLLGVTGIEFGTIGDLAVGFERDYARSQQTLLRRLASPLKAARGAGQWNEDAARRGLFLWGIKKGKSPLRAALDVKKFLFDYTELTDFEKSYMRRIIPFYTWLRKNVPLQAQMLIEKPNIFARLGHTVEGIERRGDPIPREDRPDFVQELEMVEAPFKTDRGSRAYLNPALPVMDLNKIPTYPSPGEISNIVGELGGSLNPLIRVPLELGSRWDFFRGRRLWGDQGGLADYVRAPAAVEMLDRLGVPVPSTTIKRNVSQKRNELAMPALWSYLINQIPIANVAGKSVTPFVPDPTLNLPDERIGGVPIGVINAFSPMSVTTEDANQEQMRRYFDQAAQQRIARTIMREGFRTEDLTANPELMWKLIRQAQEERR